MATRRTSSLTLTDDAARLDAPLLSVRDLRTYFVIEGEVCKAVDGVSFDISAGERLALVGESGSGKSVTALSIMGLVEAPAGHVVAGQVLLEGSDLLELEESALRQVRGRRIGYIFQDPLTALDPVFTIGSQMIETLQLYTGMTRKQARARAAELLADVHIADPASRLDDYPHQLSGGMRQRVVIALALAGEPSLVIADEPTTALDVTTQAQILELLFGLADDRGTAVLLITHDLGVVAGTCERVEVMYAGRIVERQRTEDLFRAPQHPYTRALLRSSLGVGQRDGAPLTPIPGSPPSMIAVPAGCAFHPRCSFCTDDCRGVTPTWHGDARQGSACHHAGELDLVAEGGAR